MKSRHHNQGSNDNLNIDHSKKEHIPRIPSYRTSRTPSPFPRRRLSKDFYPISIVWCPLPFLSWILPFIGHVGIVSSDGMVHDFVGPYYVRVASKRLGFGPVTRYYGLRRGDFRRADLVDDDYKKIQVWDEAISHADAEFAERMHNLICSNCHSHVATALNEVQFRGRKNWNTFRIILFMVLRGRFVSMPRAAQSLVGSFFLLVVFAGIIFLFFLLLTTTTAAAYNRLVF